MAVLKTLFLVTLALAASSSVARALDLESAIREAKERSPELHRAQAAEREASWKRLEALSGYLPHIEVEGQHFFEQKFAVIPVSFGGASLTFPGIYPVDSVTLNVQWTVFDGFQSAFAHSAASLGHDAAQLELEHAELKLESNVRLKYYQALAAQGLADVADQDVRTLNDHLAKAKAQLSGGTATRFDLLRVQVKLEEAVPEKAAADDNVVLARMALAQAMGLDRDERALTGTLPVPAASAVPRDLTLRIEQRADIQALQERADAASRAYHASLGTWLPRISLIGQEVGYNNSWTSDDGAQLQAPWRNAHNIGIAFSWNLFDGGASIARQREAAALREQAEAAATAAQLSAPTDFELWKRRYFYNVSLYGARGRALEAAEESVRLARLSYAAGTRTSSDVLDAELDLFRARAGLVRAQMDAAEALINLQLAFGKRF